jgi:serine/threonine-protein kinase
VSESTRDRISQLSGLALMIAILIIAAGVSAITAMRLAIAGTEVVVPSLVGKTEEEAASLLQDNKLLLRVSDKRFSPTVAVGKILEQKPDEGTRLKAWRSVKVLLSAGAPTYAVPNLVGSSPRAAQLTLVQRSYSLGTTSMTHTPSGTAMTIQQQDPQPGSQQAANPTVNILVSLGPLEPSFVMPDLVGKHLDQIASRIRTEGFQIGKLTYRPKSPGVQAGLIVQQEPQAGHRIAKNENISLEVIQ